MAEWKEPKANWKDADPVGRDDLKRIEENTLYLYELAAGAKSLIIAALNVMNQQPASGATFEQLAAAIEAVSTDANAVAADVVSGYSAYSGGSKINGTAGAEVLI